MRITRRAPSRDGASAVTSGQFAMVLDASEALGGAQQAEPIHRRRMSPSRSA